MTDLHMPAAHQIDQLAELIHADYLARLDRRDPSVPTHRPWAELADSDKELNRNQARNNVVKLHSIGLRVVEIDGASDEDLIEEISGDQLEALAEEEHRGWVERRRQRGYAYGPVRCDVPPDLRHPDMVAWDDLSHAVREKDRQPIRNIPAHLRIVGLGIVRR